MVVRKGEALPKEVMSLCGLHGIRHADVAEYRVGDEFVTVINARGQKFSAALVNLKPVVVDEPAKAPRSRAAICPGPERWGLEDNEPVKVEDPVPVKAKAPSKKR